MDNLLAQLPVNPTDDSAAQLWRINYAFENIVSVILALVGIVLFVSLLMGGFSWLTAGGDPKAIEAAKKTITYALGGLILVVSAYLILRFIAVFTGVNIVTNFNIVR